MRWHFKEWITRYLHPVDVGGVFLWVFAWFHNAGGAHYDLDRFWQMFITIRGWITAQHFVDSKYNSPQGQPPEGEEK
jgi:hypothetical protein